jgi:selT/selW/selH-like putative selenoprotein
VRDQLAAAGVKDIKLIPGSGGVFEVTIDGALRFSKRKLQRFPTDEEVTSWV